MKHKLTSDEFGLARMGRKRSIVDTSVTTTNLGPATMENIEGTRGFFAEVTRFTVTRIRDLTQADASKAGFLYLHQLKTELIGGPITEDAFVCISEFVVEGDPV